MNHENGYKVWIGAEYTWHLTYEAAYRRAMRVRFQGPCQIDSCATGEVVATF